MNAQGPSLADWLAGLVWALHPIRWLLGLCGVALTGLCAALALSWLGGQSPTWDEWLERPFDHFQALGSAVAGSAPANAAFRLGPFMAVCAAGWCVAGAWISRHQLLTRRRSSDAFDPESAFGPTALVLRRSKGLLLVCPFMVLLAGLLLLPVLAAGRVNESFGGIGAVLAAVLVPVVLLADFLLLFVAAGLPGWPLVSATFAAEGTDVFDAISRAYSYLFQRPMQCLLLTAVALVLAVQPVTAVEFLIAELPVGAHTAAIWLAAGLGASIFWSLETVVYLQLRASVDDEDANRIALQLDQFKPADAPAAEKVPTPIAQNQVPVGGLRVLMQSVGLLAFMTVSWLLTGWLLARTGGDKAGWLGWGLGESFAPPVQGPYWVAALIGAFWGVVWFGLAFVFALRALLRGLRASPLDPRQAADEVAR